MEDNIIPLVGFILSMQITSIILIVYFMYNMHTTLENILNALNKKTPVPLTEPLKQLEKTIIYINPGSKLKDKVTFNLGNLVGKELASRIKEIANDLDLKKYDVFDSLTKKISRTDIISYCYMEFPLYLVSCDSQDQKTWVS